MARFDLAAFLPYQLSVAATRVNREFSAPYKEFGLSVAEWRVLAHLAQSSSVSVREIYRRVDMHKSKVSRAAARLESAGLITKRENEIDRRLIDMTLTPQGVEMMDRLVPLAEAYQQRLLAQLGPDGEAFRLSLSALMKGTG
jgi:DNA-binding MarR family transcriptional regulator